MIKEGCHKCVAVFSFINVPVSGIGIEQHIYNNIIVT